MSEQEMLDVMNRGIWVAIQCCGPLLAIGGVVGLFMALVQAATQLNETSLTFVPKLAALAFAMAMLGPWLLDQLVSYNTDIYNMIASVGAR